MIRYLLRRIGYGFLILIGVNLLTFMLFFTVNTPDDMARLNIGGKRVTAEAIQNWKEEHGYDKPLLWNEKAKGSDKLTDTIFWQHSARRSETSVHRTRDVTLLMKSKTECGLRLLWRFRPFCSASS